MKPIHSILGAIFLVAMIFAFAGFPAVAKSFVDLDAMPQFVATDVAETPTCDFSQVADAGYGHALTSAATGIAATVWRDAREVHPPGWRYALPWEATLVAWRHCSVDPPGVGSIG